MVFCPETGTSVPGDVRWRQVLDDQRTVGRHVHPVRLQRVGHAQRDFFSGGTLQSVSAVILLFVYKQLFLSKALNGASPQPIRRAFALVGRLYHFGSDCGYLCVPGRSVPKPRLAPVIFAAVVARETDGRAQGCVDDPRAILHVVRPRRPRPVGAHRRFVLPDFVVCTAAGAQREHGEQRQRIPPPVFAFHLARPYDTESHPSTVRFQVALDSLYTSAGEQ